MSYTKMGYTKSIYGIIADAIKEELKIYFFQNLIIFIIKTAQIGNKNYCLISVRVETYSHIAWFLRHNVW